MQWVVTCQSQPRSASLALWARRSWRWSHPSSRWCKPHLYDAQIPPVVYLSGVLMFVGGLAIVRAHNLWARDWTVLVTLSGWFFLALGLFRMFAAGQYQRSSASTSATAFMVLEGILFVLGLIMTFKAYARPR